MGARVQRPGYRDRSGWAPGPDSVAPTNCISTQRSRAKQTELRPQQTPAKCRDIQYCKTHVQVLTGLQANTQFTELDFNGSKAVNSILSGMMEICLPFGGKK